MARTGLNRTDSGATPPSNDGPTQSMTVTQSGVRTSIRDKSLSHTSVSASIYPQEVMSPPSIPKTINIISE